MFCRACGVQNDKDSIFCANCGTKFDITKHQHSEYQSNSSQNNQYQESPQKPQYADNQTSGYGNTLYQNNPPQSNIQQGYRQQHGTYGTQQYGQPSSQSYDQYPVEDRISPLLFVLSFFIFPLGLILYFSNKRQKPKSAKNLIIVTIIGFFLFWISNP